MVEVIKDGRTTRLLVSNEDITEWLRSLADEAGLADRETLDVQFHRETDNIDAGCKYGRLWRGPVNIMYLLSNVEGSRRTGEVG